MPKYFIDDPKGVSIKLEGEIAHHLERVLRVRVGERVILCNGKSVDYHCIVESVNPLNLRVESQKDSETEPILKLNLYQSIPKSDKLEWIIQKSVELGVHSIIPIISEHSVVKKISGSGKMKRYQKIAESAAGQSMRGIIPKVHEPITMEEALRYAKGLMLAALEPSLKDLKQTAKKALDAVHFDNLNEIALWIGPEGGFSLNEVELMKNEAFNFISLGPRVLRTETAAIAAVAQIMSAIGDE